MSELVLVGKIKDAHGLKGDLYLLVFSGETSWGQKVKEVSLAANETAQKKNYKVIGSKPFKEGLILKLEGVIDRNQSEALKGQLVFLDSQYLVSNKGETLYLREMLNFEVLNQGQLIGKIQSFSSNGPQDLLVVGLLSNGHSNSGKTAEIPFVQAFIEKIDFQAKQIFMNLPEGLIELEDEGQDSSS